MIHFSLLTRHQVTPTVMKFLLAAWQPVAGMPCAAEDCAHQRRICTGAWHVLGQQRPTHRQGVGWAPESLRREQWKRLLQLMCTSVAECDLQLTHALGRHHAWDLGVGGSGGADGVEGLRPGCWRAHSVWHVLEVWKRRTAETSLAMLTSNRRSKPLELVL